MPIQVLCPFLNWVVCFLMLNYISSLYILDIIPLSNILFANIFCHSVECLFVLIVFSLFFLMRLTNGLLILSIFSKNELLVLFIFVIVSFISFSFISNLIFMISFLLLTLGFVLLSLIALCVRLGCLFKMFLVLEVRLYCYKLPS